MQPLSDPDALDALLAAPVAIVYKHSSRCPIAMIAHEQMRAVTTRRPDAPVWIVDVNAQRPLSREIAERVGVEHHSPQVIVLANGEVVWHASHFRVVADAVEAQLAAITTPT